MVCGKVSYATRTLAADVLAGTNRDHKRSRGLNKVYFCSDCNAWHTTSGGRKKKNVARKPKSEEFFTMPKNRFREDRLVIRNFTGKSL